MHEQVSASGACCWVRKPTDHGGIDGRWALPSEASRSSGSTSRPIGIPAGDAVGPQLLQSSARWLLQKAWSPL
eukprot:498251-Pleurochrysis_carterae.AAC.1